MYVNVQGMGSYRPRRGWEIVVGSVRKRWDRRVILRCRLNLLTCNNRSRTFGIRVFHDTCRCSTSGQWLAVFYILAEYECNERRYRCGGRLWLDALCKGGPVTRDEVSVEFERYCADPSGDKDIRPLLKAMKAKFKAGLTASEIGPFSAVIYFSAVEFECSWLRTCFTKSWLWFMRSIAFRGRPMWNDFHMCLWMLSRDPRYVENSTVIFRAATRFRRARANG